jgi:Na+/melibiose symporter-like transporter
LNLLIEQIDEELPKLKTIESLIKPFYSLSTIVVIPIVTMLVKWILDSKEAEGAYLVILILFMIIMIFSLFYMIKPLLEELLDLEYKRMSKLKQMIKDIKIIYFCQTP